MTAFWIAIGRFGSSSAAVACRSELDERNGLGLQESLSAQAAAGAFGMSAGSGYSSSDMPAGGTHV